MKKIKQVAYALYKYLDRWWPAATAASWVYLRLLPPFKRSLEPVWKGEGPRIALVCDDMTWSAFHRESRAVRLTPDNWRKALESERPDLFLCESAWAGPDNTWRGRVYRSDWVRYNNRRELLQLLEYCQRYEIPTAFWNKEDPAFFGSREYDFVDTALRFRYIFTTAEECVPRYRKFGHTNVHILPFGYSPQVFYPDPTVPRENTAVFAGSWYSDQPQRCRDMEALFDAVLEQGVRPVIYDRQSGSAGPQHRWPDRYQPYLRPAVPFEELGDIYRRSRYVINLNTVTGSNTMFARRVYEAIACGCIVISNDSAGLRSQLPGGIWFVDEPFDRSSEDEVRRRNLQAVQSHCWSARISKMLDIVGIRC